MAVGKLYTAKDKKGKLEHGANKSIGRLFAQGL